MSPTGHRFKKIVKGDELVYIIALHYEFGTPYCRTSFYINGEYQHSEIEREMAYYAMGLKIRTIRDSLGYTEDFDNGVRTEE